MKKNGKSIVILVVMGVLAFILYNRDDSTASSSVLNDFAIEDTASISKLFLADNDGNQSLLERMDDGTWMVNKKFKARPDNVFLILRGLHNFEVKSTVPKEAIPGIIKQIAAKPIKLEVYQGDDKPSKIYYFGFATQDHYGNYALLELPGKGKSTEPFIINEKGFYGFIRPRMITLEKDWRSTQIFSYPKLQIDRISVEYPNFPEESFEIEWKGRNNISLFKKDGEQISSFDTLAVKSYMLNYKEIYLETFNSHLSAEQADSVINQTIPKALVNVIDKNGMSTSVTIYDKGYIDPSMRDEAYDGLDPERFYILTQSGELGLGQSLQWDPLMVPLKLFIAE